MSGGVFVTGTDTGVGKTLVACALVHALRARRLRVAPMKPVAAGAIRHEGAWANEDTLALAQAAGPGAPPTEAITPMLLREAMAPHIAAAREGRDDRPRAAGRGAPAPGRAVGLHRRRRRGRLPRAPGPGARCAGPRRARSACPSSSSSACAWAASTTRFSPRSAIERAGLRLAGWVANAIDPAMSAADENVAALVERLRAPLIGRLPLSPGAAARDFAARLDVSSLLRGGVRDGHPLRPRRHAHRPREGITRCIAYALERMGREPPPPDDLVFAIGPPLRASLATLLGTDSRDAVERALAHYRERFADVGLFENAPYDGIAEALSALRLAGHDLYVATSKPRVYAERRPPLRARRSLRGGARLRA